MQTALYIIHSPPSGIGKLTFEGLPESVDKLNIHRAKLTRIITHAVRLHVPIFAEVMNEIEESRTRALFEELGINESRYQIVYGHEVETPGNLKRFMEQCGKTPNRILVSGYFKEDCCEDVLVNIRAAFPNADIVILKGDCTLSSRLNQFYEESNFPDKKRRFKVAKSRLKVRTKPVSRRLIVGN